MPSIEFDLVRETAQTNWKQPGLPWGGIPNITSEDVQVAYSSITHPYGAHALKAKYADNQQSTAILVEWLRQLSWDLWAEYKELETVRITRQSLSLAGELVVLYFLFPHHVGTGIERDAAYCKVGRAAWHRYMKFHRGRMWDHLTGIEYQATRQVLAYLYKESG